MLLGVGRHRYDPLSERDSVHNYYEHLVFDELLANKQAQLDPNFLADVACVALNRLPPRYVRHDVDMTFFLSPMELEEMMNKVSSAVKEAIHYVESRETRGDDGEANEISD